YFGDATKVYPPLDAEHHDGWVEAVYMRDNPKGVHAEFWQHTLACRRWLVVRRHTVTHDILSVVPARERAQP
ncbi:MAG: sarcosine oxidase subunit delta, partial [Betaproteobacteria bacterium]|nr:sarcosine oxidase subunit delta [Betaproteobacteria bacterium]